MLFDEGHFDLIIEDYLDNYSDPNDTAVVVGVSASWGHYDYLDQPFVQSLIDQGLLFVQAGENVGGTGISYFDRISEIIAVGAWTEDQNGYFLGGNDVDYPYIDIFANGYVENPEWDDGWNFGTSFAAPRVSAELINLLSTTYAEQIESGSFSFDTFLFSDTNPDIAALIDEMSDQLTHLFLDGNGVYSNPINDPINVMTDDLNTSLDP